MEPIYNKDGLTVGWLNDDVVYNMAATPCAFIKNGNLFDYEGIYIGILDRGFFRDNNGYAVAFMRDASGGPLPPIPEISPVPPIPAVPPMPPIPQIPPIPSIPSFNWSNISWEKYINRI
jgi:hypothetical protein